MTPEGRSKEGQLHLRTKELNNEIQNDDLKNGFHVVRGPIWDRKIVKVKIVKKQIIQVVANKN